jgi:hypothetical protein
MRRRTIVSVVLLAILVLFVGGLVIYSARARRLSLRASRHPRLHPAFPQVLPQECGFRLLAPDEIARQVGDYLAAHAARHPVLYLALGDG